MNLGTIRVREIPDSYTSVIYVQIGADSYKALYLDSHSGEVMEGCVTGKSAEKWPVVWEAK